MEYARAQEAIFQIHQQKQKVGCEIVRGGGLTMVDYAMYFVIKQTDEKKKNKTSKLLLISQLIAFVSCIPYRPGYDCIEAFTIANIHIQLASKLFSNKWYTNAYTYTECQMDENNSCAFLWQTKQTSKNQHSVAFLFL